MGVVWNYGCRTVSSGASDEAEMSGTNGRLVRDTSLAILALVALRLVAAAWTPLTSRSLLLDVVEASGRWLLTTIRPMSRSYASPEP